MQYLAHTAHCQFLGLLGGVVAWCLVMLTAGLNEWRQWHMDDVSVVPSGVAWVGIWRACYYSHVRPEFEFCQTIDITEGFVPVEISVAQVLMVVAIICGLAANVTAASTMRLVYFSIEDRGDLRRWFLAAGTLYVLTGVTSLVPLVWNMYSVLANSTIDFPPEFFFPAAPDSQEVGSAIAVGIAASVLIIICGLMFLCYRSATPTQGPSVAAQSIRDTRDPHYGSQTETTFSQEQPAERYRDISYHHGEDNPVFHTEETL
ncbi:claudin-34 [Diretmus argenteus]